MKKKGFTLIELLIVVAIIAILAAIAVPNFLEAQVRSKVSRVRSDLRTLATAIESYTADWNVSAPEAGAGPFPARDVGTGILTPAISTPVSYISNCDLIDPFMDAAEREPADVRLYTYHSYKWKWWQRPQGDDYEYLSGDHVDGYEFKDHYGMWRLFSIGPDKQWDNVPGGSQYFNPSPIGIPYDPTNGTISLGNIIRSQKFSEQKTWKFPVP
jgi:prepilin-type N-terminal cleavage/methylation domain-containing protein